MSMNKCLLKHAKELQGFDRSGVIDAAKVYVSRGKAEDAANIAAVEDHLRELHAEKDRITADVLAQWKKADPKGYAAVEASIAKSETESDGVAGLRIANTLAAKWQKELGDKIKVVMGGSLISDTFVQTGNDPIDMDVRFLSDDPQSIVADVERVTGLKLKKENKASDFPVGSSTSYMIEGFLTIEGKVIEVEGQARNKAYVGWANFYKQVFTEKELADFRKDKLALKGDKKAYKARKNAMLAEAQNRAILRGLIKDSDYAIPSTWRKADNGKGYIDERENFRAMDLNTRERFAEQDLYDWINADPSAAIDKYLDTFGPVVDADNAKELSDLYKANPGFANAVHEPSSHLAKLVWPEALKRDTRENVILTAGGAGSGKSFSGALAKELSSLPKDTLTFDSSLTNYEDAVKRIDSAIADGRKIHIIYTNTPINTAFLNSLGRKRLMRASVVASGHARAAETLRKLQDHYQGNESVSITVINNDGKSRVDAGSIDDIPQYDYTQVERSLHEIAKQEHDAGRLIAGKYKFVAGLSGSALDAQGSRDGGGKDPRSGNNAGKGSVHDGERDSVLPDPQGGLNERPEENGPGGPQGKEPGSPSATDRRQSTVEFSGTESRRDQRRKAGSDAADSLQERRRKGDRPDQEGGDTKNGGRPGNGKSPRHDAGIPAGRDIPLKTGRNFVFGDGDLTYSGSWQAKARQNVEAVELLKKLTDEKRQATRDEQAILAKFVGWGSSEMANTLFGDKLDKKLKAISDYETALAYLEDSPYGVRQRESGYYQAFQVLAAKDPEKYPQQTYYQIDRITKDMLTAAKPDMSVKKWAELRDRMRAVMSEEDLAAAERSTQNAHYTSKPIVQSMMKMLQSMGFNGGAILEPGAGIGVFPGLMPSGMATNSVYTGIEMEPVTGGILKQLFPDERILVESFIDSKIPENFYDVAFGNPPFAGFPVLADSKYAKHSFMLHDYFFAKSIDSVKPGGLLVFVTSNGTMDKAGDKARAYLAERADLVGAIRLPQTAFKKNAGTEVITDVIILRKKIPGETFAKAQEWMKTASVTTPQGPTMVNEYYAAHPEMVLGTHSLTGSQYKSDSYTVLPLEGSIEENFDKAASSLPKNIMAIGRGTAAEAAKVREIDFNPKAKKEGNFYVSDSGKLMVREKGIGTPADVKPADVEMVKDFVTLRDLLKQSHYDQLNDGPWEASLAALAAGYKSFKAKHGRVNQFVPYEQRVKVDELDEEGEPTGQRVWDTATRYKYTLLKKIDSDPDYSLVMALEVVDVEANKITDGAWLTERVLGKNPVQEAKTPTDAMLQVLNDTGTVNIEAIAGRLGMSQQEAIESLGTLVYEDPKEGWQTSDAYLSGNVVTKLKAAQEAAKSDRRYERNVEALLAAQPTQRTAADIKPQIGMSWIPRKYYEQFLKEKTGITATVHFNERTGQWAVTTHSGESTLEATADYGISKRWNAAEIFSHALDNSPIRVMIPATQKEPAIFDPASTEAANGKMLRMKEEFRSWLFADKAREDELVPEYNDTYNSLVPRVFDGRHMTLPGISKRWNVFDHVKRGAWRIIQAGNTYLAHAVGSGKTFEMIISAMEQKRLGLIQKPMMVVPNHMLQQFAREWQDLYPAARLMVADEKNFTGENRRRFISRVALSDLDGVIITHSAFKILDLDPEFKRKMIDEQLDFLRASYKELGEDPDKLGFTTGHDAKGNETLTIDNKRRSKSQDPKVKQIEKKIEGMEQKLLKLTSSEGKDTNVRFDEMGVDMLYVDEAHEFRKLAFTTLRSVKGIDSNGSQKAFDLYMKNRWLAEKHPGRHLVMASGTPITNTVAELYSVQRFMQPEVLAERGIEEFDQWASMFGEDHTAIEPDASGAYKSVTRFSKFVNVPEMVQMFREFADVLNADTLAQMLGDKRPKIEGGAIKIVITPKTDSYTNFQETVLKPRMEASRAWKRSKEEPNNPDPIIAIITDGRLGAIDTRFINPEEPNDPDSKLNKMIDGVITRYQATSENIYKDKAGVVEPIKGGAQLVFSNLGFGEGVALNRGFSARKWLEKRLKEAGIPKEEIAFMSDYKKSIDKVTLFKDVNAGKIRVVVGSTLNMGTGVNMQQRLTDSHNLDAPWYPADLEQRNGRSIRQGNKNPVVGLWAYATKGSYDEQMWSTLARKQLFIDQALSGDPNVREIEDMGEASQFEIAAAMIADDPRVLVLAGMKAEFEKLHRLESAHYDRQSGMRYEYNLAQLHIESAEKQLPDAEKQAARVKELHGDNFAAKVGKDTLTGRKEAGEAILARYKELADSLTEDQIKIGEISGFDITYEGRFEKGAKELIPANFMSAVFIRTSPAAIMAQFAGVDPVGMMQRTTNHLVSVQREPAALKLRIKENQDKRAALEPRLNTEFPMADMLRDKRAQIDALEADITAPKAAMTLSEPKLKFNPDEWANAYTPLFSRPGIGTGRLSPAAVKQEIDYAVKPLRNPPLTKYVQSVINLPFEAPSDTAGVYWNGAVWMVADNITSTEHAREVFAHEALGHYGLRGFFGKMLDGALTHIHDVNPRVRLSVQDWKARNAKLIETLYKGKYGMNDAEVHSLAIEEAMSNWAQERGPIKGVLRLLKLVQQALRAMGMTKWANKLETKYNAEALEMLRKGRMFIKDGTTISSGWVESIFPVFADPTLAADLTAQEKWLETNAKLRGFKSIDDLAEKNYAVFEKLALQWRDKHPVEVALFSRAPIRGSQTANTPPNWPASGLSLNAAPAGRTMPNAMPPSETKLEATQRTLQDNFNRFRVVQDWMKTQGVKINDSNNVYNAEIRMHGRFANKAQDFREKTIEPLIKEVQAAGFKMAQVDEFLHAQHAEERNIQIAKVNPKMQDGGSGMKTADARAILAKADPKLKALANKFQVISDGTKKILLDAGIITKEMTNAWEGAYKKYVPLLGGGEDPLSRGAGKGHSTDGKQKRALGHGERDEFIVENIARERERALLIVEHNEVGKHFLALALDLNNDAIVSINKPEKRGVLMPGKSTWDVQFHGSSIASFNNRSDALTFINTMGKAGMVAVEDKGNPFVQYMARPQIAEDEALIYVAGHAVRIQIKDEMLAREFKKLGVEKMWKILDIGRSINGWLSKAYTGLNPYFLLKNMQRDFTSGLINITADYGAEIAAKSAKNYAASGWTAFMYSAFDKSTPLMDLYREHGGNVGAAYLSDIERIGEDIKHNFERATGVINLAKQGGHKWAASRVAFEKTIGALTGWIEHLNAAGENAMRLAVFKTLIDAGKSPKEAAVAAKGMTLNFNKKGEIGAHLGAMYLFYNPAVQDVARLTKTLLKSDHKAAAWSLVGGLAMVQLLSGLMQFGDDDDGEYRRIPANVRNKNFIIRTGKDKYIAIAIPYGYGWFFSMGNAAYESYLGVDKKTIGVHLAAGFLENFSPVGNPMGEHGTFEPQELVPFEPLRDALRFHANRTGFGGKIQPDSPYDAKKPDHLKMWRSSKGGFYADATQWLNDVTGGTKTRAGFIDWSPETLKWMVSTIGGGTATFIQDTAHLAALGIRAVGTDDQANAHGLAPDLREIPFANVTMKESSVAWYRAQYYEAAKKATDAKDAFDLARKERDTEAIKDMTKEDKALVSLAYAVKNFNGAIKIQRDRETAIQMDEVHSEGWKRLQIKQIEVEEQKLYERFFKLQAAKTKKAA